MIDHLVSHFITEMKIIRKIFTNTRMRKMINPQGSNLFMWKKVYLTVSILSLFIDPLFLLVPEVSLDELCVQDGVFLLLVLTVIRSVTDLFHIMNISLQFQTAYIEPSTRVFGKGDLVFDPTKVAVRYLTLGFWIDLTAALPFPQVYFLVISPNLQGVMASFESRLVLKFIVLSQFMLRLILTYPLCIQIARDTGLMSRKAWFGAVYNFLFFVLISHVSGCCWYLLAIERQRSCWESICKQDNGSFASVYISSGCGVLREDTARSEWIQSSNVTRLCSDPNYYEFGIYGSAVNYGCTSAPFFNKFFFASWWGMQTLCTVGQNLTTSIYIGENVFAIVVLTFGIINYGLLIGYMQSYMQAHRVRLEECRVKRNNMEKWMQHRELPTDLKECIRQHNRHKWVATRGVDEVSLLAQLPTHLQSQIKRHLCVDLVRRVPLFNELNDEHMLDAICKRLTPTFYTRGTILVSEGDPLTEMLFIARGNLESYTTNGGKANFFNSSYLSPDDFYGDELLMWVLHNPRPLPSSTFNKMFDLTTVLPSSTQTVKALTDVEGFTLGWEEVKFVTMQFSRPRARDMKHKFRVYSHIWRTWAASYIQAAWRRYKRLKTTGVAQESWGMRSAELPEANVMFPSTAVYEDMDVFVPRPGSGMEVYAARLMATVRRGSSNRFGPDSYALRSLGHS